MKIMQLHFTFKLEGNWKEIGRKMILFGLHYCNKQYNQNTPFLVIFGQATPLTCASFIRTIAVSFHHLFVLTKSVISSTVESYKSK